MINHVFVVLAYKESQYLEKCIESVLNQTYKSHVIIATSTPNEFILAIAKKYELEIFIHYEQKGIGADFDFARTCTDTTLVTIAHQDDVYEKGYAEEIVQKYMNYPTALILFSDYYEIKNNKRVDVNTNLKIKRLLLSLLKIKGLSHYRFVKRSALCFGNAICCPAVTYVNQNINLTNIFDSSMKSNIDWYAWEKLSRQHGSFVYVPKQLMGHRVHDESTTSEIIKENQRSKEDYTMFCLFWPKFIAGMLTKFYAYSEKSNNTKR